MSTLVPVPDWARDPGAPGRVGGACRSASDLPPLVGVLGRRSAAGLQAGEREI